MTGIDNNILILDILTGKLLRRYEFLVEGEDNLYKYGFNINKWNNNNDNEFILNIKGNIILFELTNDNELKIVDRNYFQEITSLKRLNEKNNQFYDDNSEKDSYHIPNLGSFYNDYGSSDVSIFY